MFKSRWSSWIVTGTVVLVLIVSLQAIAFVLCTNSLIYSENQDFCPDLDELCLNFTLEAELTLIVNQTSADLQSLIQNMANFVNTKMVNFQRANISTSEIDRRYRKWSSYKTQLRTTIEEEEIVPEMKEQTTMLNQKAFEIQKCFFQNIIASRNHDHNSQPVPLNGTKKEKNSWWDKLSDRQKVRKLINVLCQRIQLLCLQERVKYGGIAAGIMAGAGGVYFWPKGETTTPQANRLNQEETTPQQASGEQFPSNEEGTKTTDNNLIWLGFTLVLILACVFSLCFWCCVTKLMNKSPTQLTRSTTQCRQQSESGSSSRISMSLKLPDSKRALPSTRKSDQLSLTQTDRCSKTSKEDKDSTDADYRARHLKLEQLKKTSKKYYNKSLKKFLN